MESVVTFRIGSSHFGVPVRLVKWIVDIEEVFNVTMMPDYVLGEIEHNENLYFLVCLEKLLQIGECEKRYEGKSAIILGIGEREFGILVDEIEKIEEMAQIRDTEETIEFVKDQEDVIEVLKDSFFQKLHAIPTMKPSYKRQKEELLQKTVEAKEEKNFLLFRVAKEFFAVDVENVQFVEVIEDAKKGVYVPNEPFIEGIYIVKNRLMYLIDFAKYLKITDAQLENILIVKHNNSYLGIGVGEILNIVNLLEEDINYAKSNTVTCCFFTYKEHIISVIDTHYIQKMCDQYGIISHKQEQKKAQKSLLTKEFVIVRIGNEELALPMDEIVSLYEIEDVHITRSLERKEALEGIVAIGSVSYLLFDLEYLVQKKFRKEGNLILVMRSKIDGKIFEYAVRIGDVEQIVQVDEKDIYIVISQEEQFIKGTIHVKKDIYNILNTQWILKRMKEENEKYKGIDCR